VDHEYQALQVGAQLVEWLTELVGISVNERGDRAHGSAQLLQNDVKDLFPHSGRAFFHPTSGKDRWAWHISWFARTEGSIRRPVAAVQASRVGGAI